jgi:hypothetical protein
MYNIHYHAYNQSYILQVQSRAFTQNLLVMQVQSHTFTQNLVDKQEAINGADLYLLRFN